MESNTKRSEYSPVSVPETMSAFSEVDSNISLDENKDLSNSSSNCSTLNPEFAYADGNIELQTSEQSFWVHEYQLNKFSALAELIQEARRNGTNQVSNGRIHLICPSSGVDICNTLRVIYTSVVGGPPKFDTNTLTSALRIATVFGYPGLREFAISSLEEAALAPIDRIQLSDELLLPQWEKPAFAELCQRTEPISIPEAQVLGIERFTQIARIREMEQRRQFLNNIIEPLKVQCLPEDIESKLDSESQTETSSLSIPACNCSAEYNPYNGRSTLHKCSLHDVAPQILNKYNLVLGERNDLLQRLKNLPSIINENIYRSPNSKTAPDSTIACSEGGGKRHVSIAEELGSASWIRHVGGGIEP
ncbi:hypothetical protein BDV93DRAFT_524715 [Ceratobasidium sp. AG-I]|nr:hypothetical protein BDV93DRAFT_524715 [Ceratobasidium sp. AG-I]